jgi:hypothetical protein
MSILILLSLHEYSDQSEQTPALTEGVDTEGVPPRCLGQKVEVRHEVDSACIEIRWAGEVVGRHTVADPMTGEVWDADHWQAAQEAALASSRGRHLSVVTPEEEPHPVALRLDIEGDVDVAVPDLARYETKGLGS